MEFTGKEKDPMIFQKVFQRPDTTTAIILQNTTTFQSSTSMKSNLKQSLSRSNKKGKKRKQTSITQSRNWKKNKWNVTNRKY